MCPCSTVTHPRQDSPSPLQEEEQSIKQLRELGFTGDLSKALEIAHGDVAQAIDVLLACAYQEKPSAMIEADTKEAEAKPAKIKAVKEKAEAKAAARNAAKQAAKEASEAEAAQKAEANAKAKARKAKKVEAEAKAAKAKAEKEEAEAKAIARQAAKQVVKVEAEAKAAKAKAEKEEAKTQARQAVKQAAMVKAEAKAAKIKAQTKEAPEMREAMGPLTPPPAAAKLALSRTTPSKGKTADPVTLEIGDAVYRKGHTAKASPAYALDEDRLTLNPFQRSWQSIARQGRRTSTQAPPPPRLPPRPAGLSLGYPLFQPSRVVEEGHCRRLVVPRHL
jgi:hypothetical protein